MISEGHKRVSIKALASLAWADGRMSQEERDFLKMAVKSYGYTDSRTVSELLTTPAGGASFQPLAAWPEEEKLVLLGSLHKIASSDGRKDPQEEEILEQAAQALFPGIPLAQLQEYWTSLVKTGTLKEAILARKK